MIMERVAEAALFICAYSDKDRMPACRFGEHRDNLRNSLNVFFIVYEDSEEIYVVICKEKSEYKEELKRIF